MTCADRSILKLKPLLRFMIELHEGNVHNVAEGK
jgi:hypothetical protein